MRDEEMTADQLRLAFFHHLYDTLVLLGAPDAIAMLAADPDQLLFNHTVHAVNDLRRYNGELIDQHKDHLSRIHKMEIEVVREPGE
jgi:hypothetical protein